mmetsp:Transcript_31203/g.72751  ORF Transcript_31203/g.72751 Transcript_31203/m.72751 type:complete len:288 (-) Transcript_31203:821-1684(-)
MHRCETAVSIDVTSAYPGLCESAPTDFDRGSDASAPFTKVSRRDAAVTAMGICMEPRTLGRCLWAGGCHKGSFRCRVGVMEAARRYFIVAEAISFSSFAASLSLCFSEASRFLCCRSRCSWWSSLILCASNVRLSSGCSGGFTRVAAIRSCSCFFSSSLRFCNRSFRSSASSCNSCHLGVLLSPRSGGRNPPAADCNRIAAKFCAISCSSCSNFSRRLTSRSLLRLKESEKSRWQASSAFPSLLLSIMLICRVGRACHLPISIARISLSSFWARSSRSFSCCIFCCW